MLFLDVDLLISCNVQRKYYWFKIEWIGCGGQVSIWTGYHYNRLPADPVKGLLRVSQEKRIEKNDIFLASTRKFGF